MRKGLGIRAMVCSTVLVLPAPALAITHSTLPLAGCGTSIVFGAPEWRLQMLTFRATVDVACPLGAAFSITLRSPSGCELRSTNGGTLRYELFSDGAMQSAVVSCERATQALHGTGRQSFVMYGRVQGRAAAAGEFHDALLASITP